MTPTTVAPARTRPTASHLSWPPLPAVPVPVFGRRVPAAPATPRAGVGAMTAGWGDAPMAVAGKAAAGAVVAASVGVASGVVAAVALGAGVRLAGTAVVGEGEV